MAELDLDRLSKLLGVSEALAKHGSFNHLQSKVNEEIKQMNNEQNPEYQPKIVTPADGPENSAVELADGSIARIPQTNVRKERMDLDDGSTGSGHIQGEAVITQQNKDQFDNSPAGQALNEAAEKNTAAQADQRAGHPGTSPQVYPPNTGIKQTDDPARRNVDGKPTILNEDRRDPVIPRRDI